MPRTFTPFLFNRSQKFQYVYGKFGDMKIKFIFFVFRQSDTKPRKRYEICDLFGFSHIRHWK